WLTTLLVRLAERSNAIVVAEASRTERRVISARFAIDMVTAKRSAHYHRCPVGFVLHRGQGLNASLLYHRRPGRRRPREPKVIPRAVPVRPRSARCCRDVEWA